MSLRQVLICAVFTLMIFIIHVTCNVDSMLINKNNAIDYDYITHIIDYHGNIQPAFVKRPIFTFIVTTFAAIFNISNAICFIVFNFIFLFTNGLLLFYLSKIVLQKNSFAIISVCTYYLCFSNLFSFFPPIYTYEEPIQFNFIFLSLIFLYKKKNIPFILSFSLAIITRESALLLIPGIFILGITEKITFKVLKKQIGSIRFILLAIPVLVYFIFIYLFMQNPELYESSKDVFFDRFSLLFKNFQNRTYAIESISSFFLVLGLPIYLLIAYSKNNKFIERKTKQHIYAFLITLFINTFIVFTTTLARESRLFAIPLLFLWPIFGNILQNLYQKFNLNKISLLNFKNIILFIILTIINYKFSFQKYNITIGDINHNYFDEYLFITILIISFHFSFSSTFKRIKKSS